MKATQILSLSVVLTLSAAQSFQSLPDCGKLCVNNMLAKAQELGCAPGDAACLCRNVDFAYGIRDCSTDVCGAQQVAPVISYGESYCKNAGSGNSGSGNSGSGNSNSSLPGPVVSPTSSSILPATTLTSMTSQGSAIATSALISVVTHGTEVSTSTLSLTTIFGTETESSPTQTQSSETSMVTSDAESSPTSSSEPSSSSSGSGTKPTAFAGLAAVAGLAAMIL